MNRNSVNGTTDAALVLSGIGLLLTGLLMALILPAGTNKTLILWGMTRHDWGEAHLWLAHVMITAAVAHVVLHWTWIVATVRRAYVGRGAGAPSTRLRAVSGVSTTVFLVGLVLGFWFFAVNLVIDRDEAPHQTPQHDRMATSPGKADQRDSTTAPGRQHRRSARPLSD